MCLGEESPVNNDVLISMTELFLTVTVSSNYSHKSDSLKKRRSDLADHDSRDSVFSLKCTGNIVFQTRKKTKEI